MTLVPGQPQTLSTRAYTVQPPGATPISPVGPLPILLMMSHDAAAEVPWAGVAYKSLIRWAASRCVLTSHLPVFSKTAVRKSPTRIFSLPVNHT